jgi:signal transduction histidine kinase
LKNAAHGLVSRLLATQCVAWSATGMIVVAFAPRLLLLDDGVVAGSVRLAAWGWACTVALVLASTLVVGGRVTALLRQLASGSADVDPAAVHLLYGAPVQLVLLNLAGTLAVCAVTLLPPFRPDSNDLYIQVEIVALVLAMASVAVLPAYVTMRASVARVLELVSVASARAAIEMLGPRAVRVARVRLRLLAAVVAPVAFVALGASLLVHAHLRAFDTSSRVNDAAEIAPGVFDAIEGDQRGRMAALETARAHGFSAEILKGSALFSVAHNDDGTTVLHVPVSDGHAVVRFRTARLSPWTGAYLALAALAMLTAWVLGQRIGQMFADDVALATRELETTGVADVLRGGPVRGGARFQSVTQLLQATDALGRVFREFARAQQRAIDARTATERTRALFLASMSHDLKAPLNAILGFTELVSRGQLTPGQWENLAIIERRGRELLYLIETILDAARAEAGELTVTPEYTRVGDVVTPAILEAQQLMAGDAGRVSGEIQPGVPRILADPARLAQALKAIILVAARFTEQGQVVVRAGLPVDTRELRIDVEVAGEQSSVADREKVFEAFKHADRVRRHGSLGLGPSLARAIVELHGGKIVVETSEVGRTAFYVWIPCERRRSV